MNASRFLEDVGHTGFVAWMSDGSVISDEDLGPGRSNWCSVDKDSIDTLELWWRGRVSGRLSGCKSSCLYYYRTAVICLNQHGLLVPRVSSRSIGCCDTLLTVSEDNGTIWS